MRALKIICCRRAVLYVKISFINRLQAATIRYQRPFCPSVYLSVCLSVRLCVYFSIYLSDRLSVACLSVCMSVCPPVCPSVCPSAYPSLCPSVYPADYRSVYMPIRQSDSPPHLPVSPSRSDLNPHHFHDKKTQWIISLVDAVLWRASY